MTMVLANCLRAMCVQGVENKRCYELNEEDINKIREEVGKYTTEADLVRGRAQGCQGGRGHKGGGGWTILAASTVAATG